MKQKNLRISVIMPAFNAKQTIAKSIESVLSQTFSRLELVIVIDGSTDNTYEIASQFLEKDERITVLLQDKSGVSAARNRALSVAKYDWIAFCDADDVWFKDKLLRQVNHLDEFAWCYTDSYYVGKNYETPVKRSEQSILFEGWIHQHLIKENFLTTSSLLIHRDLITEHGGFDESMAALEDWDLWLKIAKKNKIRKVDSPELEYLVVEGSASRIARKVLPIAEELIRRHAGGLKVRELNDALAQSYLICSYIAESNKDYWFLLLCASKAFYVRPTRLKNVKRLFKAILMQFLYKRDAQ